MWGVACLSMHSDNVTQGRAALMLQPYVNLESLKDQSRFCHAYQETSLSWVGNRGEYIHRQSRASWQLSLFTSFTLWAFSWLRLDINFITSIFLNLYQLSRCTAERPLAASKVSPCFHCGLCINTYIDAHASIVVGKDWPSTCYVQYQFFALQNGPYNLDTVTMWTAM